MMEFGGVIVTPRFDAHTGIGIHLSLDEKTEQGNLRFSKSKKREEVMWSRLTPHFKTHFCRIIGGHGSLLFGDA
jgi:hypothetical protein